MKVSRTILFPSFFSQSSPFQDVGPVFLFVQNLQDVDGLELAWFWAKDPEGLGRFSQVDMLTLGLDGDSEVCLGLWNWTPSARIFHEVFGFPADSPDIPLFLDLPLISVEWDGMHLFRCCFFKKNQLILSEIQAMRMVL